MHVCFASGTVVLLFSVSLCDSDVCERAILCTVRRRKYCVVFVSGGKLNTIPLRVRVRQAAS